MSDWMLILVGFKTVNPGASLYARRVRTDSACRKGREHRLTRKTLFEGPETAKG